jgi:hypothetical protein
LRSVIGIKDKINKKKIDIKDMDVVMFGKKKE